MTACALAGLLPVDRGPPGLLFSRDLIGVDRQTAISQIEAARRRIAAVFGRPTARPLVIHIAGVTSFWPLQLSSLASTHFFGTRACVIIGPDGRDVDVTAHELMHAEIFHRVGAWQRQTNLPTWFDEGVAMQVDQRSDFDLPPTTSATASASIHSARTAHSFFSVPPATLTRHFALAKLETGRWLLRIGPRHLYGRLADMRGGRQFGKIWTDPAIAQAVESRP